MSFGKGWKNFLGTNFGEDRLIFNYTKFGQGIARFETSVFYNSEISFYKCQLDEIRFHQALFNNAEISFEQATSNRILFINNNFKANVNLQFNSLEELVIQSCVIEKILRCDCCSFKLLSLLDTKNLGQIYIDWRNIYKNNIIQTGLKYTTEILVNETSSPKDVIEEFNKDNRHFTNEEINMQFGMLKENFHNIGYYDDEDKAYYAYMHYKRLSLKDKKNNKEEKWIHLRRAFYWLFEKVGGFGTKPHTILITAACVATVCGVLQSFSMNGANYLWQLLKGLYFSTITFFTIGYGDVAPTNAWSALLSGAEGFIGVVLMSYFTVALVRKLLR